MVENNRRHSKINDPLGPVRSSINHQIRLKSSARRVTATCLVTRKLCHNTRRREEYCYEPVRACWLTPESWKMKPNLKDHARLSL